MPTTFRTRWISPPARACNPSSSVSAAARRRSSRRSTAPCGRSRKATSASARNAAKRSARSASRRAPRPLCAFDAKRIRSATRKTSPERLRASPTPAQRTTPADHASRPRQPTTPADHEDDANGTARAGGPSRSSLREVNDHASLHRRARLLERQLRERSLCADGGAFVRDGDGLDLRLRLAARIEHEARLDVAFG